MKISLLPMVIALTFLCSFTMPLHAQGTAFTYQGRLNDGGNPGNGNYDLWFTIYDAVTNGAPQAAPLTNAATTVSDGVFSLTLDFGAGVFTGPARWLQVAVRTNGAGTFAALEPRQPLIAVPYAVLAGETTGTNVARLDVPNTATTATAVPVIANGFIIGTTITSGGSRYVSAPAVTVSDSTGSGAVLAATVSGGRVTALTVNSAGSGYSAGATLIIGAAPSNAYQVFPGTNFFTNPGNTFAGNGSGLTGLWRLGGNAGTTAGTQFLGTTDNQPLELMVNGQRALRLEPTANAPNVIGGFVSNRISPGVFGSVIAGGGGEAGTFNWMHSHYGVIGGGSLNTAGNTNLTVAEAMYTTIDGGLQNSVAGSLSTIGGGYLNRAFSLGNTIAGGQNNVTTNNYTTIGGGTGNRAESLYATVAGGINNRASGRSATVPGGELNVAGGRSSLAAGQNAWATNDGSFVWADLTPALFPSTANNQFLIRASGGVGIGHNAPTHALDVNGATRLRANAFNHLLVTTSPTDDVRLDLIKRDNLTPSARIEFNGFTDQTTHVASLDFLTRGPGDTAPASRLFIDDLGIVTVRSNLTVAHPAALNFGSNTRQMINLWNTNYGIGVQTGTTYFRTGGGFAWHQNGGHNDAANNPGAGGANLMTLDSSGNVGIGTTTPTRKLDVRGNLYVQDGISASGGIYASSSSSFISLSWTDQLHINRYLDLNESEALVKLEINDPTGKLISFHGNDGLGQEEGSITLSGNTVSYNAFTGSHYAWTEESLEPGMVASLTGHNRRLNDNPSSEIIYGVQASCKKNDSRVLGVYLAFMGSKEQPESRDHHLIAAVGNADVWVVDTGGNVEPGDYLIASAVAGHAMKDDRAAPESHIIGRAGEAVDWSAVSETIGGIKRKKISILFDRMVRENATAETQAIQALDQKLTEELKRRDAENTELKCELVELKELVLKVSTKGD